MSNSPFLVPSVPASPGWTEGSGSGCSASTEGQGWGWRQRVQGRAETPMGGGEQPSQPCVVSRVTQTGGLWAELWEVWFHQQVHLFHYLEGESFKVKGKAISCSKKPHLEAGTSKVQGSHLPCITVPKPQCTHQALTRPEGVSLTQLVLQDTRMFLP